MQSKSYIFDISNCYGSNEACGVKCKVFKAFSDISPHRACLRRGINLSKEEMREKSRELTSVTPKRTGAGQSADTRLKRAIR